MQTYQVQVHRLNAQTVQASTRSFSVVLGAKRADETAGMNPVETLLSALGSCLLTSLAMVAELSHIPIGDVGVEVMGTRQDKPPRLVSVGYHLFAQTDVPAERLQRLVQMAERNSTVFQTLAQSLSISGTVTNGAFVPESSDGSSPAE